MPRRTMTTKAPLSRNRDFMLLQVGQLLSTAGTQSAVIAYPLLVLAVTQSPAKAGIVSAVFAVFGLVLALWGTFSSAVRAAPSLDDLEGLAPASAVIR
jgi:hypothetical protein